MPGTGVCVSYCSCSCGVHGVCLQMAIDGSSFHKEIKLMYIIGK